MQAYSDFPCASAASPHAVSSLTKRFSEEPKNLLLRSPSRAETCALARHEQDALAAPAEKGKSDLSSSRVPGGGRMSIELISGKDVAYLDSQQFPIVMNALLTAEAGEHQIPLLDLTVTSQTNDPDGGIDAHLLWPAGIQHDVLAPGSNALQYKAGKISTKLLGTEFSKPDVQAAITDGGTYILCVGYDYGKKWTTFYRKALDALCKRKKCKKEQTKIVFGGAIGRWISRYPAVAALPEIGKKIPEFLTVLRWKQDNPNLANEFRRDPNRTEIIESIRSVLSPESPKSVIRVEGPAGVGKTRLALESVLDPRFQARTIYAPNADHEDVERVIQAFYSSHEIHAILVLDECDPTRQSTLEQFAENSKGRLKLVCVGIAETLYDSPQPTRTPYQLKPLASADITAIIQDTFPNAPSPYVELSTRLSGGYVKLAIFIAQVLVESGELPAFELAREFTIQTFLKKFVPPETFLSLQALSVLARIGWEEELQKEAETVAEFLSLPFAQLQRETKRLRDRGVVVPRGRYLYVSPDLLAVNAAANLWDAMGSGLIRLVEKFPIQEPRRQLLRRVAMMGEHPEVKKAVEKILSRSGLFPDIHKLNDPLLSEIFRILSSAAPEAATELLTETICNALRPELLDFKNGRRDVIWAIESLLRWPSTSLDAARALMMLALCETETIGNNATAILKEYFHVHLSRSPIPLEDRFVIIDELLAMGDSDARKLAVNSISGSLRTNENRMGGELDPLSNKPFPPEWRPKTYGDIWAARRRAIKYLEEVGGGDDDAAALARRTRLTSTAALYVEDAAAILDTTTPSDDEERRIIMEACSRILEISDLPEQLRLRLLRAREKTFGASFSDQLRRWVGKRLHTDYDLEHNSGYAAADSHVARLAQEATENGLAKEQLTWLASPEAEYAGLFGQRLGELDRTGSFEPAIKAATEDNFNCMLLAGYLTGRYPERLEAELSQAIDDIEQNKPRAAFGATWRTEPSEAGARRVIRLVRDGRIDPSSLRVFMYGLWLPNLPLAYTIQILDLILEDANTKDSEIALGIIDNHLRSKTATVEQLGESAWKAIETMPLGRVSSSFDWHWGRVAQELATANPARFATAFVRLFESDETWLATDSAQHCLRVAASADAKRVWEVVGPALLRLDHAGVRLRIKLEHWFGELIPPKVLVGWAKRKGRKGFLLAASLLTVKSGAPSESARLLIKESKNPNEVLAVIFSSLHSGFGAGPLSNLMESKLAPLRKLAEDPEPRIKAWAKAQLASEQRQIRRQKVIEEEFEW